MASTTHDLPSSTRRPPSTRLSRHSARAIQRPDLAAPPRPGRLGPTRDIVSRALATRTRPASRLVDGFAWLLPRVLSLARGSARPSALINYKTCMQQNFHLLVVYVADLIYLLRSSVTAASSGIIGELAAVSFRPWIRQAPRP
jgi:hypothetical protein